MKTTQNITDTRLANFIEDNSTVSVTADDQIFHIQTVDGRYKTELGCWILTDDSHGEIDADDYPQFDIPAIIEAAESFLAQDIAGFDQAQDDNDAWEMSE